jgi:aldehyde dehydrogenase (NAD+)
MSTATIGADEIVRYEKLFIGGEWVAPAEGGVEDSIDPATGRAHARVAVGTPADVDRAVEAAAAAFRNPEWRRLAPSERGGLMLRLAQLVRENGERLARLESFDNGQTLKDTTGDIGALSAWLTYYAGLADKIEGTNVPVRPDWHAYTIREPVGVVGAIIPWNGPLLMCAWKLGPLLAAGCTVVLKPAEQTPVTALALAELIDEAGFPAGVVNVVTGEGETVGRRLAEHPLVNKVAFTGSTEVAKEIIRVGADTMKKVSVEAGGKAPQVIFADAPLDRAMDNATFAAFRRSGQSCTSGSRVLVERSVYDEVLEGISQRARRVRVGDPRDEATFMGPHTFEEKLEGTLSYIDIGKSEGAVPVVEGGRIEGPGSGGYWISPTVFGEVRNEMRIAQEEIFGPVLTVLPFEDEEEAVAMSNSVEYGLTAGVWTSDVSRAHRMIAAIEAGVVSINIFPAVSWMLPYGGMKMSGFGRENGQEAIDLYTRTKTGVIETGPGVPPIEFGN